MSLTALWIGDNQCSEFADAWKWIAQTRESHHRSTIDDAIQNPPGRIARIIHARGSRTCIVPDTFNRLLSLYPIAKHATLLGSLCEGELRTGTPWPGCQPIYWHRWRTELTDWCDDNDHDDSMYRNRPKANMNALIGVVAARPLLHEATIDCLRHMRFSAFGISPDKLDHAGPFNHMLWDDSVVATSSDWRDLASKASIQQSTATHHWMVNGPRVDEWKALQSEGFVSLHSKPLDIFGICSKLQFGHRATKSSQ